MKNERTSLGLDHCLCTFYHVTIRDARSYDYKGQSHHVDVLVNPRVYTYAPIPGDQASLKIMAFDGFIFLYVLLLFKIMIGKEQIKNPFHAV